MKVLLLIAICNFFQGPSVIVSKLNGDQIEISDARLFQVDKVPTQTVLNYMYREKPSSIALSEIKRMSLKETIRRKKGITTYRVILVKKNNSKLEVEVNLIRITGLDSERKEESINFSSVEKISF